MVVCRVKGQKMTQNDKKLSAILHISGSIDHMMSFVVRNCKIIISPDFFLFFQNFDFDFYFGLLDRSKSKKRVKMTKNSVRCALYLKNHTSYDLHLWYACVKG